MVFPRTVEVGLSTIILFYNINTSKSNRFTSAFTSSCLLLDGKFSHLSASEPPSFMELLQQHPCVFLSSPSTLGLDTFPAAFALLRKLYRLVSDNFGATPGILIAVLTFQLT